MKHKTISIDTNFVHPEIGEPVIPQNVMKKFSLEEGDEVIAYQDEDEWDGIICVDRNQSPDYQNYIKLNGETHRVISLKEMERRNEGYCNGFAIGQLSEKIRISEVMIASGLDIITINNFTELSFERLFHMKNKSE